MEPSYPSASLSRLLKNTLAVVLAGGRGTRLHQLTRNQSKPAVPFGGSYRLIDFPLSNCINSGVRRIAVVTQYEAHTLIRHLQRGWSFLRAEFGEHVDVWPAQQQTDDDSWYSGTANALFQNLHTIRQHAPEYILVLGGDHVYKQDYSIMLAEHVGHRADVSVACIEVPIDQASQFGVVQVDPQGRVLDFQEKPRVPATIPGDPQHALVSMGVYVFSRDCIHAELERDALKAASSHDFGRDLLPSMVSGHKVMAHRFADSCVRGIQAAESYWRDVGTLDAYWQANIDLTAAAPAIDLSDAGWPIWTGQQQPVAAKFVAGDRGQQAVAIDSLVAAGCTVAGAKLRRSLLFQDVRVGSDAALEDTIVLPGAEIGRGCRIRRAIVDAGCRLPADTIVGEDPAVDALTYHRTTDGVTVVSIVPGPRQ